ncbi:MAG: DUF2029 domain-containing protein [Deltaproteobacteria bacterium]|nr:DUF2029 domain-containing protein [Deltaproteobacteria bacterium]
MRERCLNGLIWFGSAAGRRWLLRALLLYAVIGFFVWIRRAGDFAGYLTVGELVLAGRHIYAEAPAGINTWPPFFSLVCVPLALLAWPTPYLARGVWLLLNYGLLLLVLRLIVELVYERSLSLRADSGGLSLAAAPVLLPLLLTDRFVSGNFDHLQINIVIFALALGGLHLQRRGQVLAGSAALGAAVALKVMPLVFIPYLAYRGRWRAAGYTTMAAAAFSLSPILVFGWARFGDYLAAWRAALAVGWGVGKMNQSVFAMWDRWLGHGMVPFTVSGANYVRESGAPLVTAVSALSLVLIALLALWLFRGAPRREGWSTAAEWSVVFIVSALFGPLAWKAYLVVLLLPNTLLFAAWQCAPRAGRERTVLGMVLLTFLVLGALPSPGLVGKTLAGMLEMASTVTVATLVVLAGVLWLRARLAGEPPPRKRDEAAVLTTRMRVAEVVAP